MRTITRSVWTHSTVVCPHTGFPPSHQSKIPWWYFPDIPGRFLKIPIGAISVYHFSGRLHLPYTDPLPSPFSASISSFRHIHYLQLLYSSKWQFFYSVVASIVSYKYKSLMFHQQKRNSLTNSKIPRHSRQNKIPDIPRFSRKWEPRQSLLNKDWRRMQWKQPAELCQPDTELVTFWQLLKTHVFKCDPGA